MHEATLPLRRYWTWAVLLALLWSVDTSVAQQPAAPQIRALPTRALPLKLGDDARVLLLGDAIVAAEQTDAVVEMLLRRSFPDRQFSVHTLAQPGEIATLPTRPLDLATLKEGLAEIKPTLVLIGVTVTDDNADEFRDGFAQLLDAASETAATTIVLTPDVSPREGDHVDDAAAHSDVAHELAVADSLRYIDLNEVSPLRAALALAGEEASPYAQLDRALSRQLGFARTKWRIDVDVARRRQTSRGTTVTNLSASPVGVTFTARDDALPAGGKSSGDRRVLRVNGLAPGRYTLRIGREIVATARAGDWERGVTLSKGPDFVQAEALAETVVRKNRIASGAILAAEGETREDVAASLSQLSRTRSRKYELSVN